MLDDAWRDRGGAIGGVTDESADACGVLDAAPRVVLGGELHEQIPREERDDTVRASVDAVGAFDALGEVAVPALFDEALEGLVFALRVGPDAVPARSGATAPARHARTGDAALAVVVGAR
jgi:hypothetical protein